MATQYYNIANTGAKYAVDTGTGAVSTVSAIPTGGATINWTADGLPPQLQTAQQKQQASTVSTMLGTSTPSSTPYVADSSSSVNSENNTLSALSGLIAQGPNISSLVQSYQDSADSIAQYQQKLDAQRAAALAAIDSQYAQDKQDTEAAQTRETGSTNVAITRLGGYLGGSGSGAGVMNTLAATHQAELAKLSAQHDAAIQAAQNAADDKDFALAQSKIDEAKSLQTDIYNRQQDFFNNALKLQSAQQSSLSAQASQAKDILSAWSSVTDPTQIPSSQKALVDSLYGPGFTDSYMKAQANANAITAAKNQQDAQKAKLDTMQSYVNLLESVPAGTQIPFGDETLTGIGKTADISTFQITDAAGNVRVVNYNKGNGTYSMTNLGAIGKADTSGTNGVLAQYAAKFSPDQVTVLPNGQKISVMDSNGNVNPQAWQAAISDATGRGISRADFIKQYGHYLYNDSADSLVKSYGLTPQEATLITGSN